MLTDSEKKTISIADATFRTFGGQNPRELLMWDVEMVGRLDYSCYVRVFAHDKREAESLAARRFPELTFTGLTTEVRP